MRTGHVGAVLGGLLACGACAVCLARLRQRNSELRCLTDVNGSADPRHSFGEGGSRDREASKGEET